LGHYRCHLSVHLNDGAVVAGCDNSRPFHGQSFPELDRVAGAAGFDVVGRVDFDNVVCAIDLDVLGGRDRDPIVAAGNPDPL